MKAAIYARTSTLEQTPENQIEDCKRFAKKHGYDVMGVFLEHISGYKQIARPEYEKIKEMAHKREIDAVIVWALDRWVRNRDTLLSDVTILRSYGVKLHSVKEAWLEAINIEGPLGATMQDFLLGLVGSLGELESKRKSDRVKIAYQNRKKKWGRRAVHTNKKKIVMDLREQNLTLREISERTGLSLGSVHKITSQNAA